MDIKHKKGGLTMRPRTLLLFALTALLGAAVVGLPALAAGSSEAKLEVNENCVEADWPCWATPGSSSPASTITIAAGGEVTFIDHASTAANIAWTGTAPSCSAGVPVSPTAPSTNWEGKCKFEQPGTYKFESSTLFIGAGQNYTKYEIVVEGASTSTSSTTTSTTTTPTTTTTTTTTPTTTASTTTASTTTASTTTTSTTATPTASTSATAASAAPLEVKLELNENCVEADWPCWAVPGSGANPPPASKVTIAAGGEVVFTDHAGTAANLAWTGTAPPCSAGVPVSPTAPKTGWEGRCKFEHAGTYRFESTTLFNGGPSLNYTKYEIVVEGAGATPTTTPTTAPTTPGKLSGSPLEGGAKALKLARSQRGATVHGSIKISQAGAGARLEIALFAAGASLARVRHAKRLRIGRSVRASVAAGRVSFTIPIDAKAKSALRHSGRLPVIVVVTLTPPHGASVTLTRNVTLHR
jgi:hypothetical protein